MDIPQSYNPFEILRRPKIRRKVAAFTGGVAICGVVACGGVSDPEPPDITYVEAPSCILTERHVKDLTYALSVNIYNPDDLDIPQITYDFGDGPEKTYPTGTKVSHTYPDPGHWSAEAVMNIRVPEGVVYSLDATNIPCESSATINAN